MHDSVLIKIFAPAMATPISKKGACGAKCFISSDNKRQILFKNIIDFIAKKHFINKVFILGKLGKSLPSRLACAIVLLLGFSS